MTFALPFQDRENKKKEKQRQTENDYDTELFCFRLVTYDAGLISLDLCGLAD